MTRSVDEARQAIRDVLGSTGLSMRALSAAMGRDADYVAAFLDPRRRTRARPTPDDLVALSDATGTPIVELLDRVWGITPRRLAAELTSGGQGDLAAALDGLTGAERAQVIDYARFLGTSRSRPSTRAEGRGQDREKPARSSRDSV